MKKLIVPLIILGVGLSIASTHTEATSLHPGDILYLDSGDGTGGCVVKLDPQTKQQSVIVSNLTSPEALLVDRQGQLIVSSLYYVLRIDPETGAQQLLANLREYGHVWGLALAQNGDIFATYIGGKWTGPRSRFVPDFVPRDPTFEVVSGVVRVSAGTGKIKLVSAGRLFEYPIGAACSDTGELFVNNISFPGEIICVNQTGGADKTISQGEHLYFPIGIAIRGHFAYVTDMGTEDQNFGIGAIVRVDQVTGAQTVISVGDNLLKPIGIAFDLEGQIIVTDPYTINRDSPTLYDGAIIRIDPVTGQQTVLARGQGNLINPLAVAVVQ